MESHRVRVIKVYPTREDLGQIDNDSSQIDIARRSARNPDGSYTESHFEVINWLGNICDKFDILTDGQSVDA